MVKHHSKRKATQSKPLSQNQPRPDCLFPSNALFADLGLHPGTLRVLMEELGMPSMTSVQLECLPDALKGRDLLVQAKTGTGKTLCFLIPIVERLLPVLSDLPDRSIFALIVTPTRELAQQIHLHALPLFRTHRAKIHAAVGGTNIDSCREHFVGYHGTCHAVVGTPGRILDHLILLELARKAVRSVRVLVLDEVDQMLEADFWVHLRKLFGFLPGCENRQTMLFSATLSFRVTRLASTLTRPAELTKVQMTADREVNVHQSVPQEVIVVPIAMCVFSLLTLLRQEQAVPSHKILVFFNTTHLTECMARLFRHLNVDALEMFGRKKPTAREAVSRQFRTQSNVVMFTSDVSARGMDYPDVTCVIQVGMASSQEQYIHRIGRTARAGKQGRSYVLLMEFEKPFLGVIQSLGAQLIPIPLPPDAEAQVLEVQSATIDFAKAEGGERNALFSAFMAFYEGVLHLPHHALAAAGAEFTASLFALPEPRNGGKYTAEELGLCRLESRKKQHFAKKRNIKAGWGIKKQKKTPKKALVQRGKPGPRRRFQRSVRR
eukprot:GGOE01014149.1.p1 GENE.GGOE01014149.1~~GGOE01014149.1.p1  ORF type:complete len:548 (-),score=188.69 GGOE01014149.1:273-1916(-)